MSELMYGKTVYICLCNDNDFKKRSIEDNVYFTLRDIFVNAQSVHDIETANLYNSQLSDGICFEDRTPSFQYTYALNNLEFLEDLIKWLKSLKKTSSFELIKLMNIELNSSDELNTIYINFDDWWIQFKNLIKLLEFDHAIKTTFKKARGF